ncbi:MAG: hypothetical protein ABII08_00415 [Candidatus Beckwithbacteria bacterium]|nr:hypothetical protein [Patescibacteria group bacterium]
MPITNPAIPNLPAGSAGLTKYIAIVWKTLVIAGGIATLLYLAWGALDWIFSGSNQDRLKRAKDKMFNGILGLTFLALSYAIMKIISVITGLDILNPNWQILQ